jgi:hypothetical protein
MEPTRFSPCAELREILLPAYAPCTHFGGACDGIARWGPAKGHVPRGFVGALGSLDDVELVLVVAEPGKPLKRVAAEPGKPLERETYKGTDPADFLDQCAEKVYRIFDAAPKPFHRNIRWILDLCFPDLDFYCQMRRTWITESYLCSLPEGRKKPPADSWKKSWKTCAGGYLRPQLERLEDRAIVALGREAEKRMRAFFDGEFRYARHPSSRDPAAARRSWMEIPEYLSERLSERDSTPRGG